MSPDVEAFELAGDGTWTRRTGDADGPLHAICRRLLLRRVGGTPG